MKTTEKVTFLASFPDIQGQLKVGKDGLRITLEVPETELAQALKLVLYRDCVLKVIIEPAME